MTEQSTHEIMAVDMEDGVPTEPVSVETLRSGLKHDTDSIRTTAATVAAGLAGPNPETAAAVIPTLIERLHDDQRVVIYQTTMALSELAEDHPDELESAVDRLVELTVHDLELIRLLAARTLGYIAFERPDLFVDHVDTLVEATVSEPDDLFDEEALRENVHDQDMRESFEQVNLQHEIRGTYTRNVTINLLIEVAKHDPDAVADQAPTFVDLLDDDDATVVRGSAEVLSLLAREDAADVRDAVDPLIDLLAHPDDAIAVTTITALGYLGDPVAVDPLEELVDGRDDDPTHDEQVYELAADTAEFLSN